MDKDKITDTAIEFMKTNGYHPQVAIIVKDNGNLLYVDLDTTPEHKESEIQALYLLCQAENAVGVFIIVEAWLTFIQSNNPKRREVLNISYQDRDTMELKTYEIEKRDGKVIDLHDISTPPVGELTYGGLMSEAFPTSPLPLSERRKARMVANKIRKKNRKGRG
ncbi:hypothetical protein ACTOI6_19105 (plasmid) [Komagataeibacter intermedius]|uniref:hypothetical protein n=1 Tax=Komagataeibacter intermedius TaxID=66229 RepID=UPI0040364178